MLKSTATSSIIMVLAIMPSLTFATPFLFSGALELDYTSSIDGAPKGTKYLFDLTLDGSAQDTIHQSTINGFGGLTFDGFYTPSGGVPVSDFQMRLAPTNTVGTFDPSGLVYDFATSNIITVDANAAAGQSEPFNEHLSINIGVDLDSSVGSPIRSVTLNFYNSSALFDPISPSTQQLILDTSTPPAGSSQGPNGFTLDDLFLGGLSTFGDFQSTRKRQDGEPRALVDPVYFNGVSGTLGAGTITAFDVAPVPIPAAAWLFGSALLVLGALKRKKRSLSV